MAKYGRPANRPHCEICGSDLGCSIDVDGLYVCFLHRVEDHPDMDRVPQFSWLSGKPLAV